MQPKDGRHAIQAWSRQGVLLEHYCYAPGSAESLPKHVHDEYQLCLSLNWPGEYDYRGTHYRVPAGSLSVIQSGEMHAARDLADRQTHTRVAETAAERAASSPGRAAADEAGHAVEAGRFEGLCQSQIRQQRRQAPGSPRLPRARWPQHQRVWDRMPRGPSTSHLILGALPVMAQGLTWDFSELYPAHA